MYINKSLIFKTSNTGISSNILSWNPTWCLRLVAWNEAAAINQNWNKNNFLENFDHCKLSTEMEAIQYKYTWPNSYISQSARMSQYPEAI